MFFAEVLYSTHQPLAYKVRDYCSAKFPGKGEASRASDKIGYENNQQALLESKEIARENRAVCARKYWDYYTY